MSDDGRTLYISESTFDEERLAALSDEALFMEVSRGTAGALTDLRSGREVIIFGYPADARSPSFQVFEVPRKGHHALSLAIQRIVYARTIRNVIVDSDRLKAVVDYSVSCYQGVVRVEHSPHVRGASE